ncbi:hypothetical protein H310_06947 [Aphanomyces invadans]|uniref:AMP-dependent synthetase/ligase domain-containing protein n=1 Tax=Aphanomyces invadans TaxID=157072 RepID=A0A024U774_9STRA|nr:hypothetical protein H310_06947 [Aphanomyces invadans]ETW01418.1 hypothetical protein H310_06947 [Aphanomyces invadans]|eukprot:XP_008870416.1 hypothetical protein H310_06947 [Aphanomyces invadans]
MTTSDFVTWKRDGEVKIRLGQEGTIAAKEPTTVVALFRDTVKKYGEDGALYSKQDGEWKILTWNQYYAKCVAFAKSLLALGFDPFDAVSIIGFNAAEWMISDLGCILAGGLAAGIYSTNSADAAKYVADHSGARVIVCDNVPQLEKMASIASALPQLKALVVYNAPVPAATSCSVPVYAFDDFLNLGTAVDDAALEARIANQRPGHCCTLIYTSGTTGNPKAVMISHDNITWTLQSMVDLFATTGDPFTHVDRFVSYLPLSHVAAQLIDIHMPVATGVKVYFAQPDALKGSLGQTLKEVRPTRFLGVPRVWEKIAEKLWDIGKTTTGLKRRMATWAKGIGTQKTQLAQFGDTGGVPCGYGCANALVLSKIKAALGLDQCRFAAVAAAPMSADILKYFGSLDIPIFELFGQSESTGPSSTCMGGHWKIGSVGKLIPGTEWMVDPTNQELLLRGRNVMMGYLNMEKETKATIDDRGWLHSGDCARVDADQFGYITGRIKELIITAGGENVPPVILEDVLKDEIPLLSNVMVVGDKRKFLAALLTLRVQVDADGAPTPKLDKKALDIMESIQSLATTTTEARACEKVQAYISHGVKKANARATSRAQTIAKTYILEHDFSLGGGELTPTLKLKRRTVVDKYAAVIDDIYRGSSGGD